MPTNATTGELLARYLQHQLDGVTDPPEDDAVHVARVAGRRLASTLRTLGDEVAGKATKKLRRRVKRFRHTLGERRDLHVSRQILVDLPASLAGAAASMLQRLPPDDATFEKPAKLVDRAVWNRLLRRVKSDPAIDHRLAAAGHEAASDFARSADSDESPHAVRLAAKRWRDVLELVDACGLSVRSQTLARVKRLQQHLGDWHDLVVLAEHVTQAIVDDLRRGRETGELIVLLRHLNTAASAKLRSFESARRRLAELG